MSADDAVRFQHGLSAPSFLLLCTGSSKDQICFTDFACFQVSSALLCSDMACPDAQVSFCSLPAFGPKQTLTMRKTSPSTFSYIPAAYLWNYTSYRVTLHLEGLVRAWMCMFIISDTCQTSLRNKLRNSLIELWAITMQIKATSSTHIIWCQKRGISSICHRNITLNCRVQMHVFKDFQRQF